MKSRQDRLIEFRQAVSADLKTLNKISMASKRYWGYPEEWMARWKDDLTINDKHLSDASVIVLEVNKTVSGFCVIHEDSMHYEVLHLWLKPEFIGQGLGRALLFYALQEIVVRELPIIVESDPNAEVFYSKQGFVTYDKKESFPKGRFLPLMKMTRLESK